MTRAIISTDPDYRATEVVNNTEGKIASRITYKTVRKIVCVSIVARDWIGTSSLSVWQDDAAECSI
jgi:hypothetical protein